MGDAQQPSIGQSWEFGRYRICNVFDRTTADERAQIVAFWQRNGALPRDARPETRARQVVLMALDGDGELVGVNTVYVGRLHPAGRDYWFYRMFIQPADRAPGMMRVMTLRAFDALRDSAVRDKPAGVVITTENPKLMRPGMRAMFEREGWLYLGCSSLGQDVWRKDFSGSA